MFRVFWVSILLLAVTTSSLSHMPPKNGKQLIHREDIPPGRRFRIVVPDVPLYTQNQRSFINQNWERPMFVEKNSNRADLIYFDHQKVQKLRESSRNLQNIVDRPRRQDSLSQKELYSYLQRLGYHTDEDDNQPPKRRSEKSERPSKHWKPPGDSPRRKNKNRRTRPVIREEKPIQEEIPEQENLFQLRGNPNPVSFQMEENSADFPELKVLDISQILNNPNLVLDPEELKRFMEDDSRTFAEASFVTFEDQQGTEAPKTNNTPQTNFSNDEPIPTKPTRPKPSSESSRSLKHPKNTRSRLQSQKNKKITYREENQPNTLISRRPPKIPFQNDLPIPNNPESHSRETGESNWIPIMPIQSNPTESQEDTKISQKKPSNLTQNGTNNPEPLPKAWRPQIEQHLAEKESLVSSTILEDSPPRMVSNFNFLPTTTPENDIKNMEPVPNDVPGAGMAPVGNEPIGRSTMEFPTEALMEVPKNFPEAPEQGIFYYSLIGSGKMDLGEEKVAEMGVPAPNGQISSKTEMAFLEKVFQLGSEAKGPGIFEHVFLHVLRPGGDKNSGFVKQVPVEVLVNGN